MGQRKNKDKVKARLKQELREAKGALAPLRRQLREQDIAAMVGNTVIAYLAMKEDLTPAEFVERTLQQIKEDATWQIDVSDEGVEIGFNTAESEDDGQSASSESSSDGTQEEPS